MGLMGLLLAVVGLYGLVAYSVSRRTREIGIRMAVGARGRDILLQFLIEAVALSSTGGLLGIALGIGGARLLTIIKQWPTLISADSIVIAFAFSAAVGVFFGYYPARKASQLDPIDALRYE
jgi:putative ABC transport system permease protein